MKKVCEYGCGQEASYIFKNGKNCCSKHYRSCPYQAKEIGKKSRGRVVSEETKRLIGLKSKGRKSWCKDLTKETDERVLRAGRKLSITKRNDPNLYEHIMLMVAVRNPIPWNKAKTAEDDKRILAGKDNGMYGRTHTSEVKKKLAEKGSKQFSGKNNPWYGKKRSGELSPRWNPDINHTEFRRYRSKIDVLTKKIYDEVKDIINPKNYPRTKCGIKGGWQLDHIISVKEGFVRNLPPERIAAKENLQMLTWEENLKKRWSDNERTYE